MNPPSRRRTRAEPPTLLRVAACAAGLLLVPLCSCAPHAQPSPSTSSLSGTPKPDPTPADRTAQARDLLDRARRLALDDALEHARKAADMLRAALEDDPFYAPAMNDLATALLLEPQADLREAARLLEAAAKLMPGNPTPRYNLGLVLERAGLADDALAAFASALEADPRHPPSLQAIVSLQLRHWPTDLSGGARPQIPSAAPSAPRNRRVPGSLDGPALVAALRTVTRDGTTPAWRAWAADLLRRSDAGP